MIRATGLSLRRGTKLLLDTTDFVIHPGERVGLVGRNGAGKSTLFALLQGKLDPDTGNLDMPQSWRIASVEQEIHASTQAAREFVIDGDTHLRSLQSQRSAVPDTDGQLIAELETALADAGAWSAESRAEQLLAGLGFTPSQWMAPVNSFSGGWQMRLALARALMAPSELLLLDEPTNHLDLDAMLWLERWLAAYPGTVVLISHDTEFLNAVATAILHIEHQKLPRYRGDYDSFLSQRAERLRQQQAAWDKQTQESARLQSFIDRFKAKATKAKQAQSRIKALARMTALAPLHREAGITINLPEPDSMPDPLLRLDDVGIGYQLAEDGTRTVVQGVTLMVRAASRIGILGVNGAGKSTLVKTLAGELPALTGKLQPAKGLQIGYFAQHQLDMLDPEATPLQHMARLAPQAREQDLRNYLGGFGFGGEQALALVAPMSGGEKARLALALVVWRKPNLLLLDEPSNHLDVDTREALAEALAQFEGSVLLVSHDRHLLRTTVDQFWIVVDGKVEEFDGDLDDYRDWLQARNAANRALARSDSALDTSTGANRKEQRREQAQARQQLAQQRKPLERELLKVEAEMQRASTRLAELDARIADPDFYTEAQRDERPSVLAEHGELSKRNEELEMRWLELQEALETLGSA
ncbi:ATP-binding cassette domain-containing protein [Pusillimonas sp. CC-YST705]|uniref:ATP-binding cassette domain-containing protein n=1 Tax=Mesopusillimonas faecipullorum TaxID=2755040 RepID=A0ABS8C810_9BURK|nr:ATP-binding cassette domain-containing protein [Mesopusillimonas faecipullorum]MCB5362161.1 ATP-binding cassette domain-containing protein [Mesopusillimonas faecipullorum]